MKLLITTQAVDLDDPVLGFFHRWIEELAPRYEHIEIITLRAGRQHLPGNVSVYSLGKERGRPALGSFTYTVRLMVLAWKLRDKYDAVFVHQNQEYILTTGWMWNMLGKPVYLWRNHYQGSLLTDIAALFCRKIFCTSRLSYTAKYRQTVLMPVGVDTAIFSPAAHSRTARSILFFARFAPSKKPHVLLEALGMLASRRSTFTASFYGPTGPKDAQYREEVVRRARELGLGDTVSFFDGVPHDDAPKVFARHAVYVNLMEGGAYDKTIFEAAASGCVVLAASPDFAQLTGVPAVGAGAEALAGRLAEVLNAPEEATRTRVAHLERIVAGHSLRALSERLFQEMNV